MTRPHGFAFVVYGTNTRGIFPQRLIGYRKVAKKKKKKKKKKRAGKKKRNERNCSGERMMKALMRRYGISGADGFCFTNIASRRVTPLKLTVFRARRCSLRNIYEADKLLAVSLRVRLCSVFLNALEHVPRAATASRRANGNQIPFK
jgi:hypothetical protein